MWWCPCIRSRSRSISLWPHGEFVCKVQTAPLQSCKSRRNSWPNKSVDWDKESRLSALLRLVADFEALLLSSGLKGTDHEVRVRAWTTAAGKTRRTSSSPFWLSCSNTLPIPRTPGLLSSPREGMHQLPEAVHKYLAWDVGGIFLRPLPFSLSVLPEEFWNIGFFCKRALFGLAAKQRASLRSCAGVWTRWGIQQRWVLIGFGVEIGNGVDRNEEKGDGEENCDSSNVPWNMRWTNDFWVARRTKQSTYLESTACARDDLSQVRDTRKNCVCATLCAFDEVFCLHPLRRVHDINVCTRNVKTTKNVQYYCKRSDGLKRDEEDACDQLTSQFLLCHSRSDRNCSLNGRCRSRSRFGI